MLETIVSGSDFPPKKQSMGKSTLFSWNIPGLFQVLACSMPQANVLAVDRNAKMDGAEKGRRSWGFRLVMGVAPIARWFYYGKNHLNKMDDWG